MTITPEDMDNIKKHIYDLKYLSAKLGKLKLEEGQKLEDVEFSISDAIQIALEVRLIDLDKEISEKTKIDPDKIKALRVLGEIHKSLRGERTVVRNEGSGDGKTEETGLELLKKSIKIQELDKKL